MNWNEKVALITGASSGIGLETARALNEMSVRVVLAARRKDRIDALAAGFSNALSVQCDVSKESDVDRLFSATMEKFGRIDFLINNAGSGLYESIENTTAEQMEKIWRNNFMSTFYCIRRAIPVMKTQQSGHILTVSSMAGMRGTAMTGAYSATKFAQIGLMDSLRRELPEIHSTVVLPGATQTEFIEAMENPAKHKVRHRGVIQSPAEVARAIVHALNNPSARVITQKLGRTLIVFNAFSPGFTDWLVEKTFPK